MMNMELIALSKVTNPLSILVTDTIALSNTAVPLKEETRENQYQWKRV